jgi:O-antigen/teichoic acid export membrane protein
LRADDGALSRGAEDELAEAAASPPEAAAIPPEAAAPTAETSLARVLRYRLVQWTKIFSAYFSAQSVAQLLGIGAGLLFVNFMPKGEFALYTLAFSVVSFFHFLTDLGSTSSLVYFRRRAREQGEVFGDYVAAVLSLRKGLFAVGAVAVLAGFPLWARSEGFASLDSALAAVAIALAVWFQLVSSIRLLVLRLHDRYGPSYRAELLGGALRLVLAGVLVISALLHAWLGVLTAAAASALVAWAARDPAGNAEREPPTTADLAPYRRKVVRYLLPTLPSALYFSIQGPLVVWLAATYGGTDNIAEVGALSRLGMIVGLFSGLVGVVFLPRLAQVSDDRVYLRRYLQYGAFLTAIALVLLAASAAVPKAFLFVLGPHYSGLHQELLLTVGASGAALVGGYAVAVNLARSWNRWQAVAVGLLVVAQAVMVATLPLGTTRGVLTFNLLSGLVGLTTQSTINTLGFWRPRWVQW